jgi:hypothetical protein
MTRWIIALVVLFVVVVFLFGDPLKPVAYLLGLWKIPIAASLLAWAVAGSLLAAIAGAMALNAAMPRELTRDTAPTACLLLAVFAGVTILSVTTNGQRQRAIAEFAPDKVYTSSFMDSLRNAPAELQFFLHGAALKNCEPYAWSYSEMSFYELPANVAVNVLPQTWIEECEIVRAAL